MDTIIRGGRVVTSERSFRADIGIARGKIKAISPRIETPEAEIIDAVGMLVMPGVIDAHVHFQLPVGGLVSSDDFENGTKAAACGGVTTVIDFATQAKGEPLRETVAKRRAEADGRVAVDYSLHVSPTIWNAKTPKEMARLMADGYSSFKLYTAYAKQGLMSDDAAIVKALEVTSREGGIVTIHAESDEILAHFISKYHNAEDMKRYGAYCHVLSRPSMAEAEAVIRACIWAESTGGRLYFVHVSTSEGVRIVRDSQADGAHVYAETCPHYLLLDDSVFMRPDGHLYATCPQVKKRADSRSLWQGLADGTISTVATDTCTFSRKQKDRWKGDFTRIPYGLPGVETLLPLMYTFGVGKGRISENRLVALLAANPARLFGLYPQKGTIRVGSDADLVVFDPKKKVVISHENLQTNCDWSPYEGFRLTGYPHVTLSRGKIVAVDGKFTGTTGQGRLVARGQSGNPC